MYWLEKRVDRPLRKPDRPPQNYPLKREYVPQQHGNDWGTLLV